MTFIERIHPVPGKEEYSFNLVDGPPLTFEETDKIVRFLYSVNNGYAPSIAILNHISFWNRPDPKTAYHSKLVNSSAKKRDDLMNELIKHVHEDSTTHSALRPVLPRAISSKFNI